MNHQDLEEKFKTMDSERLIKWLTWIFVSAVVIVTLVFSFYFMNFKGGLSVEQDKWGVFGDFIGGTLNPILSFFALTALLLTIILQNRELEATRSEISQSRQAAQEQVEHFKNESKKSDIYKTIQVLESRLEQLYREPIYFVSGDRLRERELYFTLTFASDEALQQIIKPEVSPPPEFETELVKTKSLLMQLHLTIVKLSVQLSMLTQFPDNNAILFFYEPTINHLASKLDQIGYLPPDDKETLRINAEMRARRANAQSTMA
jgi:uncharacterized membrane protein